MTKVIGFIGVESYDLIIYLAMAMRGLGQTVALVDVSPDQSLAMTMPCEEGTDFYGKEIPLDAGYGYAIVYFGRYHGADLGMCDEIFLVTDFQKHNIEFLKSLSVGESVYPFVVMRDRLSSKITVDYLKHELSHLGIENEAFIMMEDSQADLEHKLLLQYGVLGGMKGLSQSMNSFIVTELKLDFSEMEINSVLKRLRRAR